MKPVHVILAGPVKDPNRNRTVKHGAAHAEGNSLRVKLNDETHLRLTFDGPSAMLELARQLVHAAECRISGCLTAEVIENLCTLVRANEELDERAKVAEPGDR